MLVHPYGGSLRFRRLSSLFSHLLELAEQKRCHANAKWFRFEIVWLVSVDLNILS